jgi:hypothetical protein
MTDYPLYLMYMLTGLYIYNVFQIQVGDLHLKVV